MTESQKTVLIVAYYYPPLAGIGTLRSLKLARYLPDYGWTPVVLTPRDGEHVYKCDASEGDLPGVHVMRTGYFDVPSRLKGILGFRTSTPLTEQSEVFSRKPPLPGLARRGLRMIKSASLFPDARVGWYRAAVREGLAALKIYQPQIIFSTSPPETGHLVARRLKKASGLPWVAELRDLWSDNHQATGWPRWREALDERVERLTLSKADGVVTVNETFARHLAERLGINNGRQTIIPNGYDPDDFTEAAPASQPRFTISHLGDLYKMSRSPEPLFQAVSRLVTDGKIDREKVCIRFYGLPEESSDREGLRQMAAAWGLEDILELHGQVEYQQSLVRQQGSTILLVIEILTERGKGVVPGKIFEHLGARRPTLALVPDKGEAHRLLERTAGGKAFDPRAGIAGIEAALAAWYQEWSRTGTVAFEGDEDIISQMTRQAGAQHLAAFLDSVAARNGSRGAVPA